MDAPRCGLTPSVQVSENHGFCDCILGPGVKGFLGLSEENPATQLTLPVKISTRRVAPWPVDSAGAGHTDILSPES